MGSWLPSGIGRQSKWAAGCPSGIGRQSKWAAGCPPRLVGNVRRQPAALRHWSAIEMSNQLPSGIGRQCPEAASCSFGHMRKCPESGNRYYVARLVSKIVRSYVFSNNDPRRAPDSRVDAGSYVRRGCSLGAAPRVTGAGATGTAPPRSAIARASRKRRRSCTGVRARAASSSSCFGVAPRASRSTSSSSRTEDRGYPREGAEARHDEAPLDLRDVAAPELRLGDERVEGESLFFAQIADARADGCRERVGVGGPDLVLLGSACSPVDVSTFKPTYHPPHAGMAPARRTRSTRSSVCVLRETRTVRSAPRS
jgi:hypothetical protein